MFRTFLLLFSFCVIISFRTAANNTLCQQKTDSSKTIASISKGAADVKKAIIAKKDTISGLAKFVKALIKPFKFRANEEARIRKIVEGYIQKDTANTAKQIAALKKRMPPDVSKKLDSL
ncbi:MAG: hypothetical protein JSU01_01455, partial [Bacteroidetes bacterium]|nr:hypothetical protein [Bacteroidota bacterium]